MPLITCAFLNQLYFPQIYKELESRNNKTMSGILLKGSIAAIIVYVMVGIFAYLTFVQNPSVITSNIQEAPYGKNIAIYVVSN